MTDHLDPARIGAVVFDFAGVLTSSPKAMMGEKASEVGLSFDKIAPIMMGPVDEDTDHPWHRVERGEIALETFNELAGQMFRDAGLGDGPRPPSTADEMLSRLQPIPQMLDAALALRSAGYRTAILSNNVREWSAWRGLIGADDLVEVVIDSSEVGMRKPSAEIFELTASRLDVETAACLMLDDFEWNIRGAERAGMQALHVTDPQVDGPAVVDLLVGD